MNTITEPIDNTPHIVSESLSSHTPSTAFLLLCGKGTSRSNIEQLNLAHNTAQLEWCDFTTEATHHEMELICGRSLSDDAVPAKYYTLIVCPRDATTGDLTDRAGFFGLESAVLNLRSESEKDVKGVYHLMDIGCTIWFPKPSVNGATLSGEDTYYVHQIRVMFHNGVEDGPAMNRVMDWAKAQLMTWLNRPTAMLLGFLDDDDSSESKTVTLP